VSIEGGRPSIEGGAIAMGRRKQPEGSDFKPDVVGRKNNEFPCWEIQKFNMIK